MPKMIWRVYWDMFENGISNKCTIALCKDWHEVKEVLADLESQGIDACYEQVPAHWYAKEEMYA